MDKGLEEGLEMGQEVICSSQNLRARIPSETDSPS